MNKSYLPVLIRMFSCFVSIYYLVEYR